ncbi:MAG: DUF4831 family protein [Prevotellaceae bacterium]|jgi:hypothetical protein|nr:DUF4831 family protein [Prevotellaceae bacterium]
MKKNIVILLVFSALIANAQTSTVKVGSEPIPQNSIIYFLPKTEIEVSVTIIKTIEKAGIFANYAKRLLALNDVITSDRESYYIANVRIYYNCIADSAKKYAVAINPKTTAYKIKMAESGVIECVNYTENEPLKSVLNNAIHFTAPEILLDTIFNFSVLGEDALLATSEAKMAEMVAKQILRIRESKMDIMTGDEEKNIDSADIETVINYLNETEAELLAFFTGKKDFEYEVKTFKIAPDSALTSEVLFRFSPLFGFLDKDNFAGRPITINVVPTFNEQTTAADKKIKNFGLYYNVCGSAKISVADGAKIFAEEVFTMPQFGTTNFLPAELFNNKATSVDFSEFGTILEIK